MANCPRCDTHVRVLKCRSVTEQYGIYTLERKFEPEKHSMHRFTFCCPECSGTVCFKEEEAKKILKGGT